MKKLYFLNFILFGLFTLPVISQSFTVDDNLTLEELGNRLTVEQEDLDEVNPPMTTPESSSTPTITGVNGNIGFFQSTGNPSLELSEGIILSTNQAIQASSTDLSGSGGESSSYQQTITAYQKNITIPIIFASDEFSSAQVCDSDVGVTVLVNGQNVSESLSLIVSEIREVVNGCAPPSNPGLIAGGRSSQNPTPNFSRYTATQNISFEAVIGQDYTIDIQLNAGDAAFASAVFIGEIQNFFSFDIIGNDNTCENSEILTIANPECFDNTTFSWSGTGPFTVGTNPYEITVTPPGGTYTLQGSSFNNATFSDSFTVLFNGSEDGDPETLTECATPSSQPLSAMFNLSGEYFSSRFDAENNGPSLNSPFNGTNNTVLFRREVAIDGCITIFEVTLIVEEGLQQTPPANNFVVFDTEIAFIDNGNPRVLDADGITSPDLNELIFSAFCENTSSGNGFQLFDDETLSSPARDFFNINDNGNNQNQIFVRNISANGCLGNAVPINIEVRVPPRNIPFEDVINRIATFDDIIICEESKDGFAEFDLNTIAEKINPSNARTDIDIAFFRSVAEAECDIERITDIFQNCSLPVPANRQCGSSPIISVSGPSTSSINYTNEMINEQVIGVRITERGQNVPVIRAITLKARHLITDSQVDNLTRIFEVIVCDNSDLDNDSRDEFATFDLSNIRNDLFTRVPLTDDFTAEFYINRDDLNNQMPLSDADLASFTNSVASQQDLIIVLTDTSISCTDEAILRLTVSPEVKISTTETVFNRCDDDADGVVTNFNSYFNEFILSELSVEAPVILENLVFSLYRSLSDAQNGNNPIDDTFENSASNSPIDFFIAAESGNQCGSNIIPITIQVNPAPDLSNIDTIFICYNDDDTIDDSVDTTPSTPPLIDITQNEDLLVPSAQKPLFNFEYYTSEASANADPKTTDNLIDTDDLNSFNIANATENDIDSDGIVWIRVENNTTGCFSVVPQRIIVNTAPIIFNDPLLDSSEQIELNFLICINPDASSEADFDLLSRDLIILNNQTRKEVTYYENEAAAIRKETDSNNGFIPKDIVFPSNVPETTIFFRIENQTDENCFEVGSFLLKIAENIIVSTPAGIIECDDNNLDVNGIFDPSDRGRTTFDLQTVIDDITNNGSIVNIMDISFYESSVDAGDNRNDPNVNNVEVPDATGTALPLLYKNVTPLSQQIFARITNQNGCTTFEDFFLTVRENPIVNTISEISVCDIDEDNLEIIDLSQIEPTLDFSLNIRPPNPSDARIDYFRSADDRNNHNPISNPTNLSTSEIANFEVTNDTIIFLRITIESSTDCFFDTSFSIKLNLLPNFSVPSVPIQVCENAFGTGRFDVDLNSLIGIDASTQIVVDSSLTNFTRAFYTQDNGATEPVPANLITNESLLDTDDLNLFVEITNTDTSCSSFKAFSIEHKQLPSITAPAPLSRIICDDDSDGEIISDLSRFDVEILNGRSAADFTITYFDNLMNEISSSSTLIDGATYSAEITDNRDDLLCSNSVDFDLTITRQANTSDPAPIEVCSVDNTTVIDFDDITDSILINETNPTNFTVTFHNSVAEAEGAAPNVNTIATTVMSNSFVAKVTNNTNTKGCFKTVPFEVIVNTQPEINANVTLEYCANEMDLDEVINGTTRREILNERLVTDRNNVVITYHTDNASAIAGTETNLLQTMLFVKAVKTFDSGMTCETIAPITLTEVALPVINTITNPTLTAACDTDVINDGNFAFDFSFLDSTILGSQVPTEFNVTYHFNEQDAEDNVIIPVGTLINTGTYYVKVQQNNIGCFVIEPLQITISTVPFNNLENITFCSNSPNRIISANNTNPNFTYLWEFRDNLNGTTRPDETTSSITLNPSDIGTNVTLIITDTSTPNNCNASKTVSVTESISPVISPIVLKNFDANEVTINVEEEGDFLYGFNDSNILNAQESNTFTDLLPGMFTLYVFDVNGCDPASVDVIFVDYFPAFTPNGNGPLETELWHIQGVETIPETLVYIYNRYGKLLKTLTSRSAGWDGTYNGTPLPSDDYWVLIRLPDGQEIKDHITLKR